MKTSPFNNPKTSLLRSINLPSLIQVSLLNIDKILCYAKLDLVTISHLNEVNDTSDFVNLVKTFAGEDNLVKIVMLLYDIEERERGFELLERTISEHTYDSDKATFIRKFFSYLIMLKKVEKMAENYENN